jgi:hypothetical protein
MSMYRDMVIKLLCKKIDSGEETNITRHEAENIELVYFDCDDDIAQGELNDSLKSRLSEKTLKEIAAL